VQIVNRQTAHPFSPDGSEIRSISIDEFEYRKQSLQGHTPPGAPRRRTAPQRGDLLHLRGLGGEVGRTAGGRRRRDLIPPDAYTIRHRTGTARIPLLLCAPYSQEDTC